MSNLLERAIIYAKALKEGVQQDNRTLAQLIAEQRKRNAQQKGGPRGGPPQQQKRVLPANPTMQDLLNLLRE